MDLILFAYDHAHWKTERFIHELVSLGYKPTRIVAAPWKRLSVPPAARTTVKHLPQHPRVLAERYGIEYQIIDHSEVRGGDLGVIAGARILSKATIRSFRVGVLNTHPGMIPQNRGLSNIARAIRDGLPQVITAHLIDERIDAGRVLRVFPVEVCADDDILDLGEKMMDAQVLCLEEAIAAALDGWVFCDENAGYEPPLRKEDEEEIIALSWGVYRSNKKEE